MSYFHIIVDILDLLFHSDFPPLFLYNAYIIVYLSATKIRKDNKNLAYDIGLYITLRVRFRLMDWWWMER
jgi:hypothetical protein